MGVKFAAVRVVGSILVHATFNTFSNCHEHRRVYIPFLVTNMPQLQGLGTVNLYVDVYRCWEELEMALVEEPWHLFKVEFHI